MKTPAARETIARLAREHTRRDPTRVAWHYAHDGRFVPVTREQGARLGDEITLALWDLGCRRGTRIALISETRHEWVVIDLAVLAFGGVMVGVYPTSTPDQIAYILEHSEATVALVEDAGQLDKLRSIRDRLTHLQHVIVIDPPPGPEGPDWMSLGALRLVGRARAVRQPDLIEMLVDAVEPDDLATLVYTSGTTGPPKGAELTQRNLHRISALIPECVRIGEDDVSVVFLPMAHILQRVNTYVGLRVGATGWFAESIPKLPEAIQASQPTLLSFVPRIFEKIHSRIMAAVESQPPRRQALFRAAVRAGVERSRLIQQRRPVPPLLQARFMLFERLVLRRVRERVFGRRIRFVTSGAAPISRELLEFFHGLGVLVIEGWGLTETSSPATLNLPEAFRFGTVGRPMPGVEVEVAPDGELLVRSPGLFHGYYKDPAATAEAIDAEGWFHTGDIGVIDPEGYVRITDRKKNIIITAAGKNIAPQNIESLIKTDPRISQVMVYGDGRPYLVALVTLDPDEMAAWAKAHGKPPRSMAAMAEDPDVRAMVREIVHEANIRLARFESIKRFRILPEDFSVENDLLTPTLKLKRRNVERAYEAMIDALYMDESAGVD